MFSSVLSIIARYFLLAATAITVENAVLSRAVGVSRLLDLVDDTYDTTIFSILLGVCTTLSGVMYYFIYHLFLANFRYASYIRPLSLVVCMSVSYLIVMLLTKNFASHNNAAKALEVLPLAAFNCTIAGTVLLSTKSGFDLIEMIIFGIASAFGFTLAVLMVSEGQRKLLGRDMPAAFRGLPSTLLYLAGLAMAVYGLTGHTFSL